MEQEYREHTVAVYSPELERLSLRQMYQSQYQLLDSCETKLNRRHRNSLWVKNLYINGFHIRVIVAFFDWDLIELPRVYLFEKVYKRSERGSLWIQ